MIKIAICDDEEIFIKKLRECLNKYIEETGKESWKQLQSRN